MSKVYIGIDLAAKSCVGAAVDDNGKLKALKEFPTNDKDLATSVCDQGEVAPVLMEESDLAYWARRVLIAHARKVEVADPRRNS